MDQTPPTSASAAPAPGAQAVFDGRRGPLFRLLLVNLLLTVVTVGVYRFWAKTKVRRFFWQHTRLLGDPLEYVGTGSELFVGFLIAIVILVPFGFAYSLLQFLTFGTKGYLPLVLDVVYYAVILFLIQIAIHRMRRYRLTRTAWRGVRFGLDGSSLRYATIAFGYSLLTTVTLGLAYPWQRVATLRFFLSHARFGAERLSVDVGARQLFLRWLVVLAPFLVAVAIFLAINTDSIRGLIDAAGIDPDNPVKEATLKGVMSSFSWWPLSLGIFGFAAMIWYGVLEFRYFVSRIRLADVGFRSEIGVGFVYAVMILFWIGFLAAMAGTFFGITAMTTGLAAIVGVIGSNDSGAWTPETANALRALLIAGGFILFVGFFALFGVFRTLFVDVTLLKRACATLTVSNPDALGNVVQLSAQLPSHGEGLADALDVGGF